MRKRAERRWTVMLVPHGASWSRVIQVSDAVLKGLAGVGAVALAAMVVLAASAIGRGLSVTRNRTLEREHQVLDSEIQAMRGRLAVLRDTLINIGQREQRLRLMAGLTLLDSGVQEGGIGGPAGTWPERDSLIAMGPDGREALAARLDADALARRAHILMRSVGEAYDSLSSHEARFSATPSIMPAHGRVSSPFAAERLDPILHVVRPHEGMDVAAPLGSQIMAPAAGVVTAVMWEDGYGNFLTIDHGYGVVTRFAHCSKIVVVRGQRVKRGQVIALVGSTGESTGPHVHYEVWVRGKAVDPKTFVLPEDVITD
ncbi:MAG TPA: M23 family metallopeptidase [Gemmatimonadales bacterium]|nr:M23 family metallopeptidase [Gemmatimonadales bacterium]